MSSEERITAKEYELLYFCGFHEVRGLEGVWQRGRVGVDVPLEPKTYTTEEALELARRMLSEEEEG